LVTTASRRPEDLDPEGETEIITSGKGHNGIEAP